MNSLDHIQVGYTPVKAGDNSYAQWVDVSVRWMQCPNDDCREILVLTGRRVGYATQAIDAVVPDVWYAFPQKPAARAIDPLVPDPFRRDYLEAAAILADSPKMSRVLSRRILADLLEKFAGRSEYNLASRIDKFIEDARYPSHLKDNLHHLREIGDFGAHAQKDIATGEILDAGPEEAEWTLEVIDSLFDYFIIAPERDKQRRAAWEQKMKDARRKPIKKPES